MKLQVTAWPKIGGVKYAPGDEVEVADAGLARMLIREGQARPVGTPEPAPGGPDAAQRLADVEAGITDADQEKVTAPPPAKPGRGASKDELVAYAVSQGVDAETAQGMSRAQLTAHVSGS